MKKEKKLLLVCTTLPPLVIGSTIFLKNIFERFKGNIVGISGWEYGARIDSNFQLPFKVYSLQLKPTLLQRLIEKFERIYFYIICLHVNRLVSLLNPKVIFAACTPDGLYFVAAYRVAQKYSIPFYGHMHDLWEENTPPNSFKRKLAKFYEKEVLENANAIYCINDLQQRYYQNKYPNVTFEVLPHCVSYKSIKEFKNRAVTNKQSENNEKIILYSGNISNSMNLDALKQFIIAIEKLPSNYRIIMLIGVDKEKCKNIGIYSNRITYDWVSVEECKKLTKSADVLFLPLSFKNCSKKEVQTVFATKTLDYMCSGVPILSFSPADSYQTIDASKKGWAYVIDKDSPNDLAKGIITLSTDNKIRNSVVENARLELKNRDPDKFIKIIHDIVSI